MTHSPQSHSGDSANRSLGRNHGLRTTVLLVSAMVASATAQAQNYTPPGWSSANFDARYSY